MLYCLARLVFRAYLRLLVRWRVDGIERVPAEGAVIVCGNHYHWMDPVAVACALRRPVHFMAKEELFRFRPFGALLRIAGAYPVRRGAADRSALKTTLELLAQGEVVGIFPEGTRSKTGELGKAEPGVGLFAHRARVAVLPFGIAGSYRPFRSLSIVFGQPMRFDGLYDQKLRSEQVLKAITEPVMAEVAALRAAAKATLGRKN